MDGGKGGKGPGGRPGDWFCVDCGNSNYAFRDACNRCKGVKSECEGEEGAARAGDWSCASCQTSNFKFRTECHKCSAPKDATPTAEGATDDTKSLKRKSGEEEDLKTGDEEDGASKKSKTDAADESTEADAQ
jgi:hypothetical protein